MLWTREYHVRAVTSECSQHLWTQDCVLDVDVVSGYTWRLMGKFLIITGNSDACTIFVLSALS